MVGYTSVLNTMNVSVDCSNIYVTPGHRTGFTATFVKKYFNFIKDCSLGLHLFFLMCVIGPTRFH